MKEKTKNSIAKVGGVIFALLVMTLILIAVVYGMDWFGKTRAKSYVEKNYPEIIENDLTSLFPFENMLGMPLSDLKEAVEESDAWNEDTSMWSDFSFNNIDLCLSSGYGINVDNIVYTFSNRDLNISDDPDASSLFKVIGGLINFGSVANEQATYIYVITDNSSEQKIIDMFMCVTNTEATAIELDNSVSDTFIDGEPLSYNGEIIGKQYTGSIADINYELIYDYDKHPNVSSFPYCIGYLQHFYMDGTLMLRIFSGRAYN